MTKGMFQIKPILALIQVVRNNPDIDQASDILDVVESFLKNSLAYYETLTDSIFTQLIERGIKLDQETMEELVAATSEESSASAVCSLEEALQITHALMGVN